MQNSISTPSQQLIAPRIIWGALVLSQIMYFFVASSIKPIIGQTAPEPAFSDFSHALTKPFLILALISLSCAAFLPRFLSSQASRTRVVVEANLNEPIDTFKPRLDQYFTGMIVRFAFLESISLYGFVLGLVQHDITRMIPFAASSMILLLLNFPTEKKVRLGF